MSWLRRCRPSFSFIPSGASDSPLFCCLLLPPGRLPPLSFSSFLQVIIFWSLVAWSCDSLDVPLPFHFLWFCAFYRLPPDCFPPLSSSLLIAFAETPAYSQCIMLGGGNVDLAALPTLPGSTSHSSTFMGVALSILTSFAQLPVVTSLANGIATLFLGAGSTGHGLIVKSSVGIQGIVGGCISASIGQSANRL